MRQIYVVLLYLASSKALELPHGTIHLVANLNVSQYVSNNEPKWIEQPLDHYNASDKRSIKLRYFENLNYWKPGAPIYVWLGGENPVDPGYIYSPGLTLITQLARETAGAMFATEHRYYGLSLPNISKTNKIQYYKYLSSQQALTDLAKFISTVKSDPKYRSSQVVVIGGSYAGNLAVWARKLYPDLVDAAVAASAPVLAKKDFPEFYDSVRQTLATYGTKDCLIKVEKVFKMFETLLKTASGIEMLRKILNICPWSDLTVLENQQYLFTLQYGVLTYAAFAGPTSAVKKVCSRFNPITNYLTLNHLQLFRETTLGCTDVDFSKIHYIGDYEYIEAWTHQYCTEFGYLQTTSLERQPFVHWNPLSFRLKNCKGYVEGDIERTIDDGVARTNAIYGGLNPNVTKVVFTHGDMDPYHPLGILRDLSPEAPSVMVHGSSHCGMLVVLPDETKEMKVKRKYVKDLVKKWISA